MSEGNEPTQTSLVTPGSSLKSNQGQVRKGAEGVRERSRERRDGGREGASERASEVEADRQKNY